MFSSGEGRGGRPGAGKPLAESLADRRPLVGEWGGGGEGAPNLRAKRSCGDSLGPAPGEPEDWDAGLIKGACGSGRDGRGRPRSSPAAERAASARLSPESLQGRRISSSRRDTTLEGRGLEGGVSGCRGAWSGGAASGDNLEGGGAASPPGVRRDEAGKDQLGVLGGSLWRWTVGEEGEISKREPRSGGDFRKARIKKSPH